MLTRMEFTRQLIDLEHHYRIDNAWVPRALRKDWNDAHVMTRFIVCAYNLYEAAATNRLRLTVLGGTELRRTAEYVRNFGVTAASGIQEWDTLRYVLLEQARRGLRKWFPHPDARRADRTPAPVTGSGSILSEQEWSPMLNDALIIGAITGHQDFVLGLTPFEQTEWRRLHGTESEAWKAFHAARAGHALTPREGWLLFLKSQKRMFFLNGNPRVFARELLGLSLFGYEPVFSWHQLGFRPGGGGGRPDFQTYVAGLRSVGFEHSNEPAVMQAISNFLFRDPRAIGPPWPPDTRT